MHAARTLAHTAWRPSNDVRAAHAHRRHRRQRTTTTLVWPNTSAASSRNDGTIDDDRAPTGGRPRGFVGASFYADPYDTRTRGLPSARELATNVRNLSGPMSGAARRAKSAMRPTNNGARVTKNRAEEVIERRRRVERGMREELVKKEVKNLVKERVRGFKASTDRSRDGLIILDYTSMCSVDASRQLEHRVRFD